MGLSVDSSGSQASFEPNRLSVIWEFIKSVPSNTGLAKRPFIQLLTVLSLNATILSSPGIVDESLFLLVLCGSILSLSMILIIYSDDPQLTQTMRMNALGMLTLCAWVLIFIQPFLDLDRNTNLNRSVFLVELTVLSSYSVCVSSLGRVQGALDVQRYRLWELLPRSHRATIVLDRMGEKLVATDVAPKSDLPCMVILKSERSTPQLEVYEPFTIRRLLDMELESTPMHGQKTAHSMEHQSISLFMNAFLFEKVSTRPEEVWGHLKPSTLFKQGEAARLSFQNNIHNGAASTINSELQHKLIMMDLQHWTTESMDGAIRQRDHLAGKTIHAAPRILLLGWLDLLNNLSQRNSTSGTDLAELQIYTELCESCANRNMLSGFSAISSNHILLPFRVFEVQPLREFHRIYSELSNLSFPVEILDLTLESMVSRFLEIELGSGHSGGHDLENEKLRVVIGAGMFLTAMKKLFEAQGNRTKEGLGEKSLQ